MTTSQMDIDPWYISNTMIIGDWLDNKTKYNTIIGDGVFNFNKTLTIELLNMCSIYSDRLIIRVFNHKLSIMKIANYFPDTFHIEPIIMEKQKDYTFYIWDFRQEKK